MKRAYGELLDSPAGRSDADDPPDRDTDDRYGMNQIVYSQTDNPSTPIGVHAGRAGRKKAGKSIFDRVHGTINLDPLLVAVMDTCEFQRLDEIKQLGGCSKVYPSATHTRKEHSIGVAYLAGFMVEHLRYTQPELEISDDDVLCVKMAGLLHDIGHGPFSHMFEGFVRKLEARTGEPTSHYTHEDMSIKLLRLLIERNGIDLGASDAGYFTDPAVSAAENLEFVVLLIKGLHDDKRWPEDEVGRPESKRFLLDIVANKRNGIDVDKLDYLARDSAVTFGSDQIPGFDHRRIILASKARAAPISSGARRERSARGVSTCAPARRRCCPTMSGRRATRSPTRRRARSAIPNLGGCDHH